MLVEPAQIACTTCLHCNGLHAAAMLVTCSGIGTWCGRRHRMRLPTSEPNRHGPAAENPWSIETLIRPHDTLCLPAGKFTWQMAGTRVRNPPACDWSCRGCTLAAECSMHLAAGMVVVALKASIARNAVMIRPTAAELYDARRSSG